MKSRPSLWRGWSRRETRDVCWSTASGVGEFSRAVLRVFSFVAIFTYCAFPFVILTGKRVRAGETSKDTVLPLVRSIVTFPEYARYSCLARAKPSP